MNQSKQSITRRPLPGVALVSLLILVLPQVLAPSSRAAAQLPAANSDPKVPFELVTRLAMLSVAINGSRSLSFLLDTGDKPAIVDLDRARELGLALTGQVKADGVGAATLEGSWVRGAMFSISGLKGFSQPVTAALPIASLSTRFGHDCDGLLGADFVGQFVVEFDYQSGFIALHNPKTFTYSGPGESVWIQLNAAGQPVLEAEVTPIGGGPIRGKFVLDTGSAGATVLHSPFVTDHHLLGPHLKTVQGPREFGVGGVTTGRSGRVSAFRIGRFTLTRPAVLFSQDTLGEFSEPDAQGTISEEILTRFKLFLDYSHNRIIFEPNATFGKAFDRASSGLSIDAEGRDYKTFRVSEVLEDSPAAEAGLRPGDIVTAVNERTASTLTLTELLELFAHQRSYRVTARRGQVTVTVTLRPRVLI